MYSSNPTDYQKFTASPQQSAPPPYSHPANAIPVSSTNQFYHEMPHHQPPSAPSLYGQPQSGIPVNSGNQFTASPQQSAPPPYSHPANSIPVSSTNQFYHEMPHHQPPSAPSPYGQPQSGIPVNSGNQYYSKKPQPAIQVLPKSQVPWSTGLCDCCEDVPNCCITCWCPCITFGRIAEIVGKGFPPCGASGALYTLSIVVGFSCIYSCCYRSKMRQQYLLHGGPCGDCLVHCCCECCALCQEYRELKNRGFNMAIGWHGNMEKRNREMGVAPVVEGGMSR